MACDDLSSSLAQSDRPAGDLTTSAHEAVATFCRSFSFPASTPPPSGGGFVTFGGADIVTFAGDAIAPF